MLSFILQVNRPHPGDHPLLIIFMVGGVTVSEVKMVKDLVATRKPGTQVKRALTIQFLCEKRLRIHRIMFPMAMVLNLYTGRNGVRILLVKHLKATSVQAPAVCFLHVRSSNKTSNSGWIVYNRWHYSEGAFIMSQKICFFIFFINQNICYPKSYRLPGSTSTGQSAGMLGRSCQGSGYHLVTYQW